MAFKRVRDAFAECNGWAADSVTALEFLGIDFPGIEGWSSYSERHAGEATLHGSFFGNGVFSFQTAPVSKLSGFPISMAPGLTTGRCG